MLVTANVLLTIRQKTASAQGMDPAEVIREEEIKGGTTF